MISVIAWIIAIGAWVVITLAPVALVGLLVVPSWRRWWLRPLQRRKGARRARALAMQQSRRDARSAVLELELDVLDEGAQT